MSNRDYCEEYIQLKKLEHHYWGNIENILHKIDVNGISGEVKVLAKHQKTINNILSKIVDRLDSLIIVSESVDEGDIGTQV